MKSKKKVKNCAHGRKKVKPKYGSGDVIFGTGVVSGSSHSAPTIFVGVAKRFAHVRKIHEKQNTQIHTKTGKK